MEPRVRVTGVLIEDCKLLLTEQHVTQARNWSLPGGGLEYGETIEQCIIREVQEETGLDISVKDLLYVCDHFQRGAHIVHIILSLIRTGGALGTGNGAEFTLGKIKNVRMVPLVEIEGLGFSRKFYELAKAGFPNRGSYQGTKANIGL
jgi:ADP-ribose pyrophosphatase YjhB (NUDIX family)